MDADGPTLTTGRLTLEAVSADDLEDLHRISNEPGVRRYLWDDTSIPEAEIRGLIAGSVRLFSEIGVGLFGVRLRDDDRLLGFCGFVLLEGMDEPELAYELTRGAWGRGLATEASRACLRYAFEEVRFERVIAGADPPNVASLRVIEKLGMKPIGDVNPNAPDEPYYALYREAFYGPEV